MGVVLLLLIVGGAIWVQRLAHQALPEYEQNLKMEGIKEDVTVYRDSAAVPHIYASNEHDLYLTVGYLMAQDRLWQMDLLRRVTQGRLSAIFGEKMLENDMIMRSLRIPQKSREVLERSSPPVRQALEAFSQGVNAYIKDHENQLPPEFTILGYEPGPWKPVHSINLIGYMAWDLSPAWEAEIVLDKIAGEVSREKLQLMIPKISEQDVLIYPDYDHPQTLSLLLEHSRQLERMGLKVFTGSNNWAVSGEKSVTGKPLFANDMHLSLNSPGIWYQMHQVIPDKLNVTGVALPGAPMIISGHNDSIAWGMTNVMLDDMDFYHETLHPEDSAKYRYNGQWRDMKVMEESFAVKGGDTLTRKLYYTHRGPVVSRLKDLNEKTLSMRWVGNEYSNELRSVYLLNRASRWKEFKNAVRTFISVSQNIAYADVNGNIGLYCCGGIPVREGDLSMIYPGDTSRYDWKGLVPFEELPYKYNPESGMVSSANNKTVDPDYPHHISHWFALAPRINRIRQMLSAKEQLSVQDFIDIQTDHKSLMVDLFRDKIIARLKGGEEMPPLHKKALEILEQWDGVYRKDSPAAVIFEQFYLSFLKNLIHDELGSGLYKEYTGSKILVRNLMKNIWNNPRSPWCDDVTTKDTRETFADVVRTSYEETVMKLSEKMGKRPEKWEWGRVHQLEFKHPIGGEVPIIDLLFGMNKGPYATGGSFHTVCPYSYSFKDPFEVIHGASHRHVYSTADWNRSRTIIPTGISGIPASKHYCDQTERYINKEYRRDLVDKDLIRKNARYRMNISAK
jgi:penicillin amidase